MKQTLSSLKTFGKKKKDTNIMLGRTWHLTKPTPTCAGEQKSSFTKAAGRGSWLSNIAGEPNSWFTTAVGEPNSLGHLWVSCGLPEQSKRKDLQRALQQSKETFSEPHDAQKIPSKSPDTFKSPVMLKRDVLILACAYLSSRVRSTL